MPNWNYYQTNIDGEIASVFLDLNVKIENEYLIYNNLCWLFIKLRLDQKDGLSHQDEFDQLCAHEDDIINEIDKSEDLYVGRITTQGMRQFYFYTSNLSKFDVKIRNVVSKHKDYLFQINNKLDSEWNQYDTVIYPGEYGLEQISERE